MEDKKEECAICFEEFTSLKILECGHTICLNCIEASSETGDTPTITIVACPFDRKNTLLPDGKAQNLKTKFFVSLPCESCYVNKSINESWWCETCQCTTCSDCAMKKHRDHTCKQWNDFDVVKECFSLYKSKLSEIESSVQMRNSIHEFCVALEECLMTFVDEEEKSKNASIHMEHAFGPIEAKYLPDGYVVEKLEKKLNAVSKLMQTDSVSVSLPKVSNVVERKRNFPLPTIEKVLDFCCKLNNPGPSSSSLATPSKAFTYDASSPNSISSATNISLLYNLDYHLTNPACILCSLPDDNVVVLDQKGIHIVDVSLDKCVKFVPWSFEDEFDFYSQASLRPIDNVLLLSTGYLKSYGNLFQYELENLSYVRRCSLPTSPKVGFGNKRLISVVNQETTLVASSDGSTSVIWVQLKNADVWTNVWQGKLQIFWDMQIVDNAAILIAGQTKVYQFSVNALNHVTFLGEIWTGCGPLFQLTDNVYQIDNSHKKLVHIFQRHSIKGQRDYDVVDNEQSLPILIPINNQLLCSLSLSTSKLRVFCFS